MSERVFYPDTNDVSSTSKVVALSIARDRTRELILSASIRPGRIDLLAPAHLKLAPSPTRSLLPSQFYLLCRSHPCGSIRSGGRVNDSPYQTVMVVRTLITSSGVRPHAE